MGDSEQGKESAAAPLRTLLGLKSESGPGRIVVWDTEEIVVGRSPECDIVVEDSDSSRRHALFSKSGVDFIVEDLGTPNGTRVNDAALAGAHKLEMKDSVVVGEMTITFIKSRRDPAALGLEVSYASDLKGFAGAPSADPESTMLGLTEVAGPFAVGSVGDFASELPTTPPEPEVVAPPTVETRDLDRELEAFLPDMSAEAGEGDSEGGAPAAVSLHLELEGLTPDLRRALETLQDKTIELPALRIRIKG
jgi:hypothetical protein